MASPTAPPAAPVKAPSRFPSFITDLVVKYAVDAAPMVGAATSKSISGFLARSSQAPLSAIEEAHVTGVVVMLVTRLANKLKDI